MSEAFLFVKLSKVPGSQVVTRSDRYKIDRLLTFYIQFLEATRCMYNVSILSGEQQDILMTFPSVSSSVSEKDMEDMGERLTSLMQGHPPLWIR